MFPWFRKLQDVVSLCWENISYSVPNTNRSRKILDNICGYVEGGNVLCIVGHSGSGKTSLMEILCGMRRNSEQYLSGSVYYNNILSKTRNYDCSIYCPQDCFNLLNQELTISECIKYSCDLKDCSINIEKMNHLLNAFGLIKCRDTLIKNASFGERKRCYLATQIINQPNVLFLDEILSGLDSKNAYNIFNILNELKNYGHTIIISIHQPSQRLFQMMNRNEFYLTILQNGQTLYFDKTQNCIPYFSNINIIKFKQKQKQKHIDDIIDIVDNEENETILIQKFNQLYKQKILNIIVRILSMQIQLHNNNQNKLSKILTTNIQNISIQKQIFILTKRNVLLNTRNIKSFWMRAVSMFFSGLLFGLQYFHVKDTRNSIQNHTYFLNVEIVHGAMLSLANIMYFLDNRNVYISQRFYSNKYCPFAYCASTFLSMIPWIFLNCLLFVGIALHLVDPIPVENNHQFYHYFIMHFICFFCLSVCMEVWSLFLSTISREYLINFSAVFASTAIFAQFCGGPMLLLSDTPYYCKIFYYLSPFTYATKYMMYLHFHDLHFKLSETKTVKGDRILENFEMQNVNLFNCILMLCGLTSLFQCFFYLSLKHWVKPRYYYNN